MKLHPILLLILGLFPIHVFAWSNPGEAFSGDLKIGGEVVSSRNPWVWKLGSSKKGVDVKVANNTSRSGEKVIPVDIPATTILIGKTSVATPSGREGLAPLVTYGGGEKGVILKWMSPGVAEVSLPVKGSDGAKFGTLTFKMQAMSVLRYRQDEKNHYLNLYNDLNVNGLPGPSQLISAIQLPGLLENIFEGEGLQWLKNINVTGTSGVSRFNDSSLRQVEGVYAAQTISGTGKLLIAGEFPSNWSASLPVSIEYQ
ncbi:hypothetical protein [Escherichia coli]|uniref:F4 family fimbrial subunit n=1 Tax=Escherichia coli TaxID=562 RepID=UPI0001789D1F|nr:hypothetical protein [Escherichia coli]EDV81588.1 RalI [Escherichia coli E22]EFN8342433.1 fimbrial protein [Escherichia coli]